MKKIILTLILLIVPMFSWANDADNFYLEPTMQGGSDQSDYHGIESISWGNRGDFERIIFNLEGSEFPITPYKIVKESHPTRLTIEFPKIKDFQATMPTIYGSKYIREIYIVPQTSEVGITLAISLKHETKYRISKIKDPLRLFIDLTDHERRVETPYLYSVRTQSFSLGENITVKGKTYSTFDGISHIMQEAKTSNKDNVRFLKSIKGRYLVEVGLYTKEKDAKRKIKELKTLGLPLYTEKRSYSQEPADL